MRQAAYILAIIQTCILGIFIIPLAWMIPMTLQYKKAQTDGQDHIALGVCSILFMMFPLGIISGVFVMV